MGRGERKEDVAGGEGGEAQPPPPQDRPVELCFANPALTCDCYAAAMLLFIALQSCSNSFPQCSQTVLASGADGSRVLQHLEHWLAPFSGKQQGSKPSEYLMLPVEGEYVLQMHNAQSASDATSVWSTQQPMWVAL